MNTPITNTQAFNTAVESIISASPGTLTIAAELFVGEEHVIDLDTMHISDLYIHQDMMTAYRDSIKLVVQLKPSDIISLMGVRQNLKIHLKVQRDMSGNKTTIINTYYRALIVGASDIDKIMSIPNTEKTDNPKMQHVPVTFELLVDKLYEIKKNKFNFILHNVTMMDTLFTICSMLEYKQVYIETPDNTIEYKNMIIPPLSSIENIFDFLQSSPSYHGIYRSGIGYYIQEDFMFIYPLLEPNRKGMCARFFNMDENLSENTTGTFTITDSSIDIGITNKMQIVDKVQKSIENQATAYSILAKEKCLDQIIELQGESPIIRDDTLTTLSYMNKYIGPTKDVYHQQYDKTNNFFRCSAKLFSNFVYHLSFTWANSIPYILTPNMPVSVIRDTKLGPTQDKGIIGILTHHIHRSKGAALEEFICSTDVKLVMLKLK